MPCRTIHWQRNYAPTATYNCYVRNKAAARAAETCVWRAEYERLKKQCAIQYVTLRKEAPEHHQFRSSADVVRHFGYDCRFSQSTGDVCPCLKVVLPDPSVPAVVGEGGEGLGGGRRQSGVLGKLAERWRARRNGNT